MNALHDLLAAKSSISATRLDVPVPEKFDYEKFKETLTFVFNKISKTEFDDKVDDNLTI